MMVRKRALLSSMRFSLSDSTSTWSYSLSAAKNMIDVTFSKQWIHLRRSDRWPPTSTMRNVMFSSTNGYSMMPVVGTRTLSTSCSVGKQSFVAMRSRLSRQLYYIAFLFHQFLFLHYYQSLFLSSILANRFMCVCEGFIYICARWLIAFSFTIQCWCSI